jgi:hypothetical protein
MILPPSFDSAPGFKCLVFGGKELEVQKVQVIVEEDDEMVLSMRSDDGEWATQVRVYDVERMSCRRFLRWREGLSWVLGDDTGFAASQGDVLVDFYACGNERYAFHCFSADVTQTCVPQVPC